jgi:excisionase family DNA binding protein
VDEDAPTEVFVRPASPRPNVESIGSFPAAPAEGPPPIWPPVGDVLTADDAAALLGVSRWTLYAAANRHEVPHRRVGRRMLFSRRALLIWLEGASLRGAGKE